MKLERVIINNFHCYQNATFNFGERVTLLIGKNGSGKSSLIKALKNALSIFFTFSNSNWEFDSIVGSVPDLKIAQLNLREIWHDNGMQPAARVSINMFAAEPEINWSFVKSSIASSKVQSSYYKNAFLEFRRVYGDRDVWPMFAYYSDRFPHIDAKLGSGVKQIVDNDIELYRAWGYYHWDKDDSCALIWQKRYARIYDLLFKRQKRLEKIVDKDSREADALKTEIGRYEREIEFVLSFVRRFSSSDNPDVSDNSESLSVSDIIVDGEGNDSYLVAYFADGNRRRWDELPAGYERLYNIVFDIAYRSYILNGDREPCGIVMIDEIDLHLHPSMEQDVLQRLLNTFPRIQFIISTHSPLVIGNTSFGDDGKVILLRHDDGVYDNVSVSDPFGLDYDFILSAVMNTEPRNVKLQMLKEKYLRLRRRDKNDLAETTLEEIKSMVKSDSRYGQIVEELNSKLEG